MNVFVIVALVIFIVLLLTLFIAWLISYILSKRFHRYIKNNEITVRTFIINKHDKTVRFFDKNNIRNVRGSTLDQFLSQFSADQVDKINNWLDELLKKTSKVEEYLEVEIYIDRLKKKCITILKCTHVDYEKKIIHLDSYLFLHLAVRNKIGRKNNDVLLEDALKKLRIHPALKGYTYHFKITCFKGPTIVPINRLLFTQIKEIATSLAYPPYKFLTEITDNEFAIIDTRSNEQNAAMDFVHHLVNSIRCFLEMNGLLNITTIAVGMVSNSYFPGNIRKLVSKAEEMSQIAYEKNCLIVTYNKDMLSNQDGAYTSEIEQIIKEKKLQYSFTPVFDVNKCKVIGYINNTTPVNASAKTMNELYLRSVKAEESKKLLQAIVKDAYGIFNSQNTDDDNMIFLFMKLSDAHSFLSFARLSAVKETNTVAIFDEYDVQYYKNNNKDLGDIIAKFKAKKIMPCLRLSDKSLILDGSIYALFSYFIVAFKSDDKIHRSTTAIDIDHRLIVEKLLKYNRPIIVSNVVGWTNIELLVRSGINYIASPTLVNGDRNLAIPNSKAIAKIKRMTS